MQAFKQAFLKQLLLSLQVAAANLPFKSAMSLKERKDAVKLSSDIAMAFARGHTTWTRALVVRHSKEARNAALVRSILGRMAPPRRPEQQEKYSYKSMRSKRILRRSHRLCSRRKTRCLHATTTRTTTSSSNGAMARLQVLKRLIPGGEALHGFSLLSETLDYVVCLKTQVELMQCLCKGSSSQG